MLLSKWLLIAATSSLRCQWLFIAATLPNASQAACGAADDYYYYSPWRAPGDAPVYDSCGLAGGGACLVGPGGRLLQSVCRLWQPRHPANNELANGLWQRRAKSGERREERGEMREERGERREESGERRAESGERREWHHCFEKPLGAQARRSRSAPPGPAPTSPLRTPSSAIEGPRSNRRRRTAGPPLPPWLLYLDRGYQLVLVSVSTLRQPAVGGRCGAGGARWRLDGLCRLTMAEAVRCPCSSCISHILLILLFAGGGPLLPSVGPHLRHCRRSRLLGRQHSDLAGATDLYRLCKLGGTLNELCFQQIPLAFQGLPAASDSLTLVT